MENSTHSRGWRPPGHIPNLKRREELYVAYIQHGSYEKAGKALGISKVAVWKAVKKFTA